MPDPGRTEALEDGWVVTTEFGMTEPIWQLTLELWKQGIVDALGRSRRLEKVAADTLVARAHPGDMAAVGVA
jgi:hypothetical protein